MDTENVRKLRILGDVRIKKIGLELLYNVCFIVLIPYFYVTKCLA